MNKELSDSLLAACKAAGIEKPRYIAQDEDGSVLHYRSQPSRNGYRYTWGNYKGFLDRLNHPPYANDWKESLMEWVEPQNVESTLVSLPKEEEVAKIWDGFVNATITELSQESIPWDTAYKISKPQGEPPANVLARHPDHVADTSKMIDDACEIAYHAHIQNGNGFRWSRADCYRAAWQDALAWKGGDDD